MNEAKKYEHPEEGLITLPASGSLRQETRVRQTGEEGVYFNSKGAYAVTKFDHARRLNDYILDTHKVFISFSNKEFELEWQEKQNAFTGMNKEVVNQYFNTIVNYLRRYSPKSIVPVLTNEGSIHVSASFDFFTIYIEAFFEAGQKYPAEMVLNIYSNKVCRVAATGSWNYVTKQIEKFIFEAIISLLPTFTVHGLSEEDTASSSLPYYFLGR